MQYRVNVVPLVTSWSGTLRYMWKAGAVSSPGPLRKHSPGKIIAASMPLEKTEGDTFHGKRFRNRASRTAVQEIRERYRVSRRPCRDPQWTRSIHHLCSHRCRLRAPV